MTNNWDQTNPSKGRNYYSIWDNQRIKLISEGLLKYYLLEIHQLSDSSHFHRLWASALPTLAIRFWNLDSCLLFTTGSQRKRNWESNRIRWLESFKKLFYLYKNIQALRQIKGFSNKFGESHRFTDFSGKTYNINNKIK